jgi:hypothetical protein
MILSERVARRKFKMSDASTYAALNQLLIDLGRSLLQYVGECWPWSGTESQDAQRKIEALVEIQKDEVLQLGELLDEADWTIDQGTYPTEYTDLHYVALSYLLDQLVQNQRDIVEEAQRVLTQCESHAQARRLVSEIHSAQQRILDEIQTLAQSTSRHDSTKFTNQATA